MSRFLKVMPRLPVTNLEATIAFYDQVLGLAACGRWPEGAPSFALLERDQVCVQFYTAETSKAEPVGNATLSFEVDDAMAMHRAIAGRVAVEWGPEVYFYGRREFAIRDPDGYLIIISEETADPPTCDDVG